MAEIVGEAQSNNDRRDITGALAMGDGAFLQVLEGRKHELDALLVKLVKDPRHTDVEIVGRRPIDARMFTGWAMKGPLASATVSRLVDDVRSRRVTADKATAALASL